MTAIDRPWWSHPGYAAVLILLMAVPLLSPAFPPLSDLPVHMGRYRIQAGMEGAATLAGTFSIHWMPVGNLGVDALVRLLGPALGIEPATKVVVLLIPVLTAAGMLFVAAEIHGRLPPTSAFALPLAYGYPFQFGFVNYALSVALALLAFGLALRLARREKWHARTALLLGGGIAIYFCHVMGWVVFGLLCLTEAAARRARQPGGFWPAARDIATDCLPLAAPLLFIVIWRSADGGGATSALFDLRAKWGGIESALRERWVGWDGYCALGLLGVFLVCAARPFAVDRRLGLALAALAILYLCIPYAFFGLLYADTRLAPLLLAVALLSLGPRDGLGNRIMGLAAVAALAFFVARIAVTTISMGLYAEEQGATLKRSRRCRQDRGWWRWSISAARAAGRRRASPSPAWRSSGRTPSSMTSSGCPAPSLSASPHPFHAISPMRIPGASACPAATGRNRCWRTGSRRSPATVSTMSGCWGCRAASSRMQPGFIPCGPTKRAHSTGSCRPAVDADQALPLPADSRAGAASNASDGTSKLMRSRSVT